MALDTLTAAQAEAARLMGANYQEFAEAQRPRVHELGTVALANFDQFPAFRAHSGPEDLIGKGGARLALYNTIESARATVEELSVEMLWKLFLRGYTDYKGAKALIVADASTLSHLEKVEVAKQFEHLMEANGLVGHRIDIPAGDVGTNGLATEYALERHSRHPEDPYWQAVVTGKSPEVGGLEFRTAATGWGAYVAHRTLMESRQEITATASVQGFGNAGAWYAHFATTDPDSRIRLKAISDREGTLTTSNAEGITITREMVELIGDNPKFNGPKLRKLAAMIENNQPGIKMRLSEDASGILTYPVNYFVPAAMGNVITESNVESLGANVGVIEVANGPTKLAAHRRLVEKGLSVAPDIWTNGSGVDASNKEHRADIAIADGLIDAMPSTEQIKKELTESGEQIGANIFSMAKKLETKDLRVAAAAVSMAKFASRYSIDVDPELRELVAA